MNRRLSLAIAFLVGWVIADTSYKRGLKANDEEVKGYHTRYLKLYPFEGDMSYEDFDYIFGHQDDEFYPNNTWNQ